MIDGLSHDEGGASWRSEEIERSKMLFYYYWYGSHLSALLLADTRVHAEGPPPEKKVGGRPSKTAVTWSTCCTRRCTTRTRRTTASDDDRFLHSMHPCQGHPLPVQCRRHRRQERRRPQAPEDVDDEAHEVDLERWIQLVAARVDIGRRPAGCADTQGRSPFRPQARTWARPAPNQTNTSHRSSSRRRTIRTCV